MRVLTKKKVEKIKQAIADGTKQTEIAKRFKASRSVVSDIATGRVHKDVEWPGGEPPTPKRAGGQHKNIPDYDPTDKRVLELEAEIVHLTDERNRERQKVKAGAKIAGLFKAVVAEMDQRIKPFAALPLATGVPPQGADHRARRHAPFGRPPRSGRAARGSRRPGRLQLPRLVLPCRTLRQHGRRMDATTPWPRSSTFPVLWVLAYGDYTSGEIHKACERSYYRNQFKNCLAIGQLARPDVPRPGRPLRAGQRPLSGRQPRPADAQEGLPRCARQLGLPLSARWPGCIAATWATSSFTIPDAWSANVNINGVGFNVSHGDDVRSNLGIPWYGMVRRQKGLIALGAAAGAQRCRYFVRGPSPCRQHLVRRGRRIAGQRVVGRALMPLPTTRCPATASRPNGFTASMPSTASPGG